VKNTQKHMCFGNIAKF